MKLASEFQVAWTQIFLSNFITWTMTASVNGTVLGKLPDNPQGKNKSWGKGSYRRGMGLGVVVLLKRLVLLLLLLGLRGSRNKLLLVPQAGPRDVPLVLLPHLPYFREIHGVVRQGVLLVPVTELRDRQPSIFLYKKKRSQRAGGLRPREDKITIIVFRSNQVLLTYPAYYGTNKNEEHRMYTTPVT